MITRRHVIGAVAGGAIASALAVPGVAAAALPAAPMFRAVCDLKLEGGRALRDAARAAGFGVSIRRARSCACSRAKALRG